MTYPILPFLGVTLSLTFIAGSVMAIPIFVADAEPEKLGNIELRLYGLPGQCLSIAASRASNASRLSSFNSRRPPEPNKDRREL